MFGGYSGWGGRDTGYDGGPDRDYSSGESQWRDRGSGGRSWRDRGSFSSGYPGETEWRERGYGDDRQWRDRGYGQEPTSYGDWSESHDVTPHRYGGNERGRDWNREPDWEREGARGGREYSGRPYAGWRGRESGFSGSEGYGYGGGYGGGFGRDRDWSRERDWDRARSSMPRGAGYGWGTAYGGPGYFDLGEHEHTWRGDHEAHPMGRSEGGYPTGSPGSSAARGWRASGEESFPNTTTWDRSYAGRGPRGYQRSDDRICEDVCQRLTDHPAIDASRVEVTVENGEVTLSGTVDDRLCKRLAEDIAESVSGVREVSNQLRLSQRETQPTMGTTQSQQATTASTTGERTRTTTKSS